MTTVQFAKRWNNSWRYDYWWRQKHNVAFNSQEHRDANPIDIRFEFIENVLMNQAIDDLSELDRKKKALAEGRWIEPDKDNLLVDRVMKNIDLSSFA